MYIQIFVFKSEKNLKKKKRFKPANQMGGGGQMVAVAMAQPLFTGSTLYQTEISCEPHNSNVFHTHIDPYCPPSLLTNPPFWGFKLPA